MPYYGTEHMAKSSGTLAPTVSMQAVCWDVSGCRASQALSFAK